jgi:hypothetical protein
MARDDRMKKSWIKNMVYVLIYCMQLVCMSSIQASEPIMLLRLNVSGQGMHNETVVYFDSTNTFAYNNQYDAVSLGVSPGYLNIVTRFDSIDFQIKGLPLLTQNMSVPVKVVTGTSGSYQIYGIDIQNLPAGACLILHDNLTNSNQDLRTGAYTCSIMDTESVVRFVLNITISMLPVSGSFINPTCSSSANGSIMARAAYGTTLWNYYWKDSLNNIIKTSLLKNTPDTLADMSKGAYRVDINTNGTCNNGTLIFSLQNSLSPVAYYTTSSDTVCISNMNGVAFANKSKQAENYWWDFGDGTGVSDTSPNHYYTDPGTYRVTLTAFGSVCPDTSVYSNEMTITADETTAIKQTIGTSSIMLINRDIGGYYVQFNYNAQTDAIISVYDLFGQKVNEDFRAAHITHEKIYINIPTDKEQVLIISVISATGQKVCRKIIN